MELLGAIILAIVSRISIDMTYRFGKEIITRWSLHMNPDATIEPDHPSISESEMLEKSQMIWRLEWKLMAQKRFERKRVEHDLAERQLLEHRIKSLENALAKERQKTPLLGWQRPRINEVVSARQDKTLGPVLGDM